jgi:hypothetical protein
MKYQNINNILAGYDKVHLRGNEVPPYATLETVTKRVAFNEFASGVSIKVK